MKRLEGLAVLAWLAASTAAADVRLPRLLSDHMVLQRDRPAAIWGWATPDERVTVRFRGQAVSAAAGRDGRWRVTLPPSGAGGPFDLVAAGANTITLRDVLVGDVWVGSGQSNMGWPLSRVADAEREIAQATDDRIRVFDVPQAVSEEPREDVGPEAAWAATTPETVKDFSAILYFFAREQRRVRDVPIGLVHSSWGGTPAEAWTSRAVLADDPALQPLLWQWRRTLSDYPGAKERFDRTMAEWEALAALAKAHGKDEPKNPPRAPRGPGDAWTPGGLYGAMIAPLTPFAVRGILWYQGESNAQPFRAREYRRLFPAMIESWRNAWNQGVLPFLFVQLPNYKERKPAPGESLWAELRESQAAALVLPNTAMAVTIDIGEAGDIHPKNKQDVARRLALLARGLADGETLVHSGPVAEGVLQEGTRLRVRFRHTGSGLAAKDGGALVGFAVAGADRRFVWADARIEGDSVVVSSRDVPHPVSVRYAWADNPECNLYNREGLPAAPFRAGDWRGETD